ncbi:MAG: cytochrome c [Rhizobiales bacterium]|nr:cytochrome c [Hyphomicrobiales bacterium]
MKRCLVLASLLLTSAASQAARADVDRARLADLVRQDCGSCHGLTLKGGLGRPLTAEALAHFPVETVRDIILDGLPGTPMPPWRPLLSVEEASAIADMLKRGDTK